MDGMRWKVAHSEPNKAVSSCSDQNNINKVRYDGFWLKRRSPSTQDLRITLKKFNTHLKVGSSSLPNA